METKIIKIDTERTIEQNFASIGVEYLSKVGKNNLAIYGTIDEDTGIAALVVRPEVVNALMQIVNQVNQQWKEQNGVQ